MTNGADPRELAAARAIHEAFTAYWGEFQAITGLARARFEQQDWAAGQRDATRRLDLYDHAQDRAAVAVRLQLGADMDDRRLWVGIKRAYTKIVTDDDTVELAETFFSSLTRRVFSTVGATPEIEFLPTESRVTVRDADASILERFDGGPSLEGLIARVLEHYAFAVPYEDLPRDAALAAAEVEEYLASLLGPHPVDAVETLAPVFFRHKAAFIIGRIKSRGLSIPLVLPLRRDESGVVLDAVLMSQDEVSILFSFARSYFHVDSACLSELLVFLKTIMPLKPVSELYTSLGFNRHGKTELFRDLHRHLADTPEDRFHIAEGARGMVMIVFALERYDVVFKVIRDRFEYPKNSTPRQVKDRYRLVFTHDRVGRLVDAQEFEHLEFPRQLFRHEVLDELLSEASQTVTADAERVVIQHLYTERKLTPLDLYLQKADPRRAAQAVVDYGYAIKELAAANIFPGDFLLKNFGVTRHGRVVFYDYDELCLLTDCRFRRLPEARFAEEELESEPWFAIADNDIFPEEFERFLGLDGALRDAFLAQHRDLFTVDYWRELQERHRAGQIMDFFPYPKRKRLAARDR